MAEGQGSLVAAIHAAPASGVFAVTGGGSGLLTALLTVGGASATVLEARIPYAAQALGELLGSEPEQACSARTARALAMQSLLRARQLGGSFGFGITAALATNRQRRGAARAHLAYQDAAVTRSWRLALDAGASRQVQEQQTTETAVAALAFALGVGAAPVGPDEATAFGGEYADVVHGDRSHVAARRWGAILPGAFDPLHEGHRAMRVDAARRLGVPVGFELSVANVDKPPLDYIALQERLGQFGSDELVVTNAPTFVAKAQALGGVTFVVGVDTVQRIAATRYYGSEAKRDQAFATLRALGCRFLVYGRLVAGSFRVLADCTLPPALASLCTGVPAAEFRQDISSTALRQG